LHEQEASTAAFFTAEGIELKPTYSEKILKTSITLILVLAYLRVPILLCMCVAPGPFNMLDSTAEESNFLST
jgi:hypothetical protein